MDEPLEAVTADAIAVLRRAGARFAYLHGSRAAGQHRAGSDIDIAAYFGGRPPNSFDVLLPSGVDLLILDDAPLELAGRVAVGGRLLFEDDRVSRVRWEAVTRVAWRRKGWAVQLSADRSFRRLAYAAGRADCGSDRSVRRLILLYVGQ